MAVYTPKLGLVKQSVGENPNIWGSVQNSSFIDLTDEAISGRADIDVTDGDVTLSIDEGASSDARHMILRFTGTPALPVDAVVPQLGKLYVLDNQCGETVTVRTATGIGVDVEDGEIVAAMVDESLNRVVKLAQHDQNIVPLFSGDMEAIGAQINNVASGDESITIYTMDEGNGFKSFWVPEINFVDDTSTSFIVGVSINPTSGVFPVANRQVALPVYAYVNSVVVLASARFSATSIFIRQASSGNLGVSGATIKIQGFSFTMANAPNS